MKFTMKQFREQNNIPVEELAKITGLSVKRYLSKEEHKKFTFEEIWLINDVYKMDLDNLVG